MAHELPHLCQQLNIKLPIIQAPMAGGLVTPELMAGVSKHGGLSSLPLGYLSIEEAQKAIRHTKTILSKSFAVNIFVPSPHMDLTNKQVHRMIDYINDCRKQLGLESMLDIPSWIEPDINELVDVVIAEEVPILSFTFGILNQEIMRKLHQHQVFVMGTATTVHEGLALEEAGCDAVIAQGYEAGGHRGGGFLMNDTGGLIGSMALVPQMVDALTIPVIASGGIMDGRGIAAALLLGASAVQLGTAFLTCHESNASPLHKRLLLEKAENSTCITSSFTGKPVRSFSNHLTTTIETNFLTNELPPYPLQHHLTKELRSNANKLNCPDYAGLWSGQGTRLSRSISVANLMNKFEEEINSAISRLK